MRTTSFPTIDPNKQWLPVLSLSLVSGLILGMLASYPIDVVSHVDPEWSGTFVITVPVGALLGLIVGLCVQRYRLEVWHRRVEEYYDSLAGRP